MLIQPKPMVTMCLKTNSRIQTEHVSILLVWRHLSDLKTLQSSLTQNGAFNAMFTATVAPRTGATSMRCIGPPSLADPWVTPHQQDGDMSCFSAVAVHGTVASVKL